jgi:hypothetical protein
MSKEEDQDREQKPAQLHKTFSLYLVCISVYISITADKKVGVHKSKAVRLLSSSPKKAQQKSKEPSTLKYP